MTALSGSGPAYVFLLLEALQEAGRQMGLPTYAARRLAEQTLAGSAALAAASAESPAELRRNVTSPGGTTEAAVAILESSGVRASFVAAVLAARDKAEALGKPALAPRSTIFGFASPTCTGASMASCGSGRAPCWPSWATSRCSTC